MRLAKFFLDERGRDNGRELYQNYDDAGYMQDHLPVTEQKEAVGHAVRAVYMYSAYGRRGLADRGGRAISRRSRRCGRMSSLKSYISPGASARDTTAKRSAKPIELPNATAYAETCAAIALMLWNHRMFLLHGDAKYLDVLERTLYNGFLAGVSLGGDTFFYPEPARVGRGVELQPRPGGDAQPLVRLLLLPDQRGAVSPLLTGICLCP